MDRAERLLAANTVFWRGPSVLTGEPILCLAGKHTINAKTGPMVQIYILRADIDPITAVKSGGDAAICGDCKLRGDGQGSHRACYVQWFRAPFNIWGAEKIESNLYLFAAAMRGKYLRIGAYGDPAAVPVAVWALLVREAKGWTAYTHQWRTCGTSYRELCMASVDSPEEYHEARAMGWRTFRVRLPTDPVERDEIVCPASDEGGHRVTCRQCQLCRGANRPAKSIAIYAHGPHAYHYGPLRGQAPITIHRRRDYAN